MTRVRESGPIPASAASDIPWMFPEGVVSGVFMSVWASTQSRPIRSPRALW